MNNEFSRTSFHHPEYKGQKLDPLDMESRTLAMLRDILLPKLLSGEINLATVKQRIS